ncbi:GIY-YIG nuclease family protein [Paludibacterium paludis]|uniref:GIY-YIG domain-containing protein n=1 Tax=Paludibacterium paludis TaxID=1225769 RepID=A0A918P025_9NEIS|nr:GIY-YIG nuclease family protein [Paludibacterium paludis]GGY09099.1 hypothetical protein GCM10011289_09740 [Paludibacterium paludis]
MSWFLYILECSDGSLYTGVTTDVANRYRAHASGRGARYTRGRPPRALRAVVAFDTRSEALSAECAVKAMPRAAKLAFCEAHADTAHGVLADAGEA